MSSKITQACTNCDKCREICPSKATMNGSRTYVIDPDLCANCLLCVPVCPVDAIENPALPKKKKERKIKAKV